jgi:polar amino acid transport system substrate-binding protein
VVYNSILRVIFHPEVVPMFKNICALFAILTTFPYQPVLAQSPLKLINDPWPPFTGETLPGKGVATEIVSTALNRAGFQTVVEFVPWKRALEGTIDGTYDILITTSYSEERAKKVAYSNSYLSNTVRLIKRKNTPYRFDSLEDIRGLVVGVTKGYIYEPQFDKATFFTKDDGGENVIANLKKLAAGRIDLFAEDELVAGFYLKENFSPDTLSVEYLPNPLNTKDLHIIVRKTRADHEQIISAFNDALADMHADGTYTEILVRQGYLHSKP